MPAGLPEPLTPAGRAGLSALLADPGRALLAFDFDGTLAPIVTDPSASRLHPGALPTLARLASYVGELAVITGRPAATALELGGFAGEAGLARLVVLGHYGQERWDAATGQVRRPPVPPGVAQVRRELPAVLARTAGTAGARVEDKGSALAVHTRTAADPEGALEQLRAPLIELAERTGLVVEPGRFVLELRAPGGDKGSALAGLAAQVPEPGPSVVCFAGDDLGDLRAFDAVDGLRAAGTPGLLLCSGSEEVAALAARADLVLDGPAGVVGFLDALAETLAAGT